MVTGIPEEVLAAPVDASNVTRVTLCFGSLRVLLALCDPAIDPQSLRNRCVSLKAHLDSQGHWVSQEEVIMLGVSAQHEPAAHVPVMATAAPAASPASPASPSSSAAGASAEHPAPQSMPRPAQPSAPSAPSAPPSLSEPPVQRVEPVRPVRPANASPFATLSAAARRAPAGTSPAFSSSPPAATRTGTPVAGLRGPGVVRPASAGGLAPSGPSRPASSGLTRGAAPARPAYAAPAGRKPFDPDAPLDELDDVPF